MLSKMLTGSMMLGGIILGVVMVILEPSVSETETFAVAAQNLIANKTQTVLFGAGFTVGSLAALIGTAYFARSMQGENKLGSDLAGLASILGILSAVVLTISSTLRMSVVEAAYTDRGADTAVAYALSEGMWNGSFLFIGAAIFFLGIAIVRQKNLNWIVGAITGLFGVFLLIGMLGPHGDPGLDSTSTAEAIGGILWFLGFIGWAVMTMVIGGILIKQTRAS